MNKEDIAFYQAKLVMKVARSFSRKDWKGLAARSQKKYVEQAINVIWLVLNER